MPFPETLARDFSPLHAAVQRNCHISDGLHAQSYGLCTYLLKMRELYRWEKRLPFTAALAAEDIGAWLNAREQLWEDLAEQDFAPLPVGGALYDPFAAESLNRVLAPRGLVYGGGYGRFCKPLFFLGKLHEQREQDGVRVWVVGEEYARDLSAPPAMSQGRSVYLRRESVRRALWERIEEWQWKKPGGAVPRLLAGYGLEHAPDTALARMTEDELGSMLAHELGEIRAGALLGASWEELLLAVAGSKAELLARAVRDHLADCLSTLPHLLEQAEPGPLLLYFANLRGMHKALFPALDQAYQAWLAAPDSLAPLREAVAQGRTHWLRAARELLEIFHADPQRCAAQIGARGETWQC